MSIDNPLPYISYAGLQSAPNGLGSYDSSSPKSLSGSIISSSGLVDIIQDDYKVLAAVKPGGGSIVYKPSVYVSGSDLYMTSTGTGEKYFYAFTIDTSRVSAGSTNGTTFRLPLTGTYPFTASVDWGDGVISNISSSTQTAVTHVYPATGSYLVRISGSIANWYFNNAGDKMKIININSWGDLVITNSASFSYCINLDSFASDKPVIATTRLDFTFGGAYNFNGYINDWDMSNVTSLRQFLHSYNSTNVDLFVPGRFNQPVDKWNVGKVTDFSRLFTNQCQFNQPIGMWDMSSAVNLEHTLATYMIKYPGRFNQDVSKWNTSNVTSLRTTFQAQYSFNQDISSWDVSKVTDISFLFSNCPVYNKPLNTWNTVNVTASRYTFAGCTDFNQPLSNWNTSKIVNMIGMFDIATSFNQDISSWDVSKVTIFDGMFASASAFNQNISNWNVSSAVSMSYMFEAATSFDQNLGSWDVRNVASMTGMFDGVTLSTANYDGILNGWNSLPTLKTGVNFSGGNSKYSPAASASRSNLISTYGWTITDGGPV